MLGIRAVSTCRTGRRSAAECACGARRTLFNLFGKSRRAKQSGRLEGDDTRLFHPLSESPSAAMRAKGELIRRVGQCPISGLGINYECPISGYPTHHSEQEWQADAQHQREFAWRLRQSNEDDHDLRSGRPLTELVNLPYYQDNEFAINFASWDTFFFTRGFKSVDSPRSVRHLSKLLTYPVTIASVLHPFSPYQPNMRLTTEGLRSMTALRYTLDSKRRVYSVEDEELLSKPIRIIILGARTESMIPREVWLQGGPYIFPNTRFEVHFVGPEAVRPADCPVPLDRPYEERSDPRMTFTTYNEFYHKLHDAGDLAPFDPYQDVFYIPCPGFGHPVTRAEWEPTISRLLETKCPIIVTGFSPEDVQTDFSAVNEICKDEHDILIEPGENAFASRKWDFSEYCPSRTTIQANWGLFAFRGKRYEVKLG